MPKKFTLTESCGHSVKFKSLVRRAIGTNSFCPVCGVKFSSNQDYFLAFGQYPPPPPTPEEVTARNAKLAAYEMARAIAAERARERRKRLAQQEDALLAPYAINTSQTTTQQPSARSLRYLARTHNTTTTV